MTFLLSRKGIVHKFTFVANVYALVILTLTLTLYIVPQFAMPTLDVFKVLTIKAMRIIFHQSSHIT